MGPSAGKHFPGQCRGLRYRPIAHRPVFRSGCCYHRGKGKVFYFSPGHETYGIYHQREIQLVIGNAVRWAAPAGSAIPEFGNRKPLEELALG